MLVLLPLAVLVVRCLFNDAICETTGRLCGVVVRVAGYRSRDPGFDLRRYQIFWEVVGLERGPLSLGKVAAPGLENRD
jgi:hypothetical protein